MDTAAERAVNPGVPGLQETLLYHFVPARLQSAQLETREGIARCARSRGTTCSWRRVARGVHGRSARRPGSSL